MDFKSDLINSNFIFNNEFCKDLKIEHFQKKYGIFVINIRNKLNFNNHIYINNLNVVPPLPGRRHKQITNTYHFNFDQKSLSYFMY